VNIAQKLSNLGYVTELAENKFHNFSAEWPRAFHFRTIFRWITVKNLNTMQFDENLRGDTPMGLLRGIKHGTESYHVLFKRLCRSAYCECVAVVSTVMNLRVS
jgi:hypothetical protein